MWQHSFLSWMWITELNISSLNVYPFKAYKARSLRCPSRELVKIRLCTTVVRNMLKCIGKHSFSYECKRMRMLSKHSYVFFVTLFTLTFLPSKIYLIINNEYKSMVFTILWGCLPYSNDWNILECECTYGSYNGGRELQIVAALLPSSGSWSW